MLDFFANLFNTDGFPPRWFCGQWTSGHGWLHVVSDLLIWGAYTAIPVVLLSFIRRRPDVPFYRVFWLFGLFIFACGATHLMDALLFWWPAYRLSGVIKAITAVASWATVLALVPIIPRALALPGLARVNAELEEQVVERHRAEEKLRRTQDKFRLAVEASPSAVVLTNAKGVIDLVNTQAERLFGYPREELIGQSVELLVPERFRRRHPGYRDDFYHKPHARPMGAGRDLFGLRKDGTEVPVEIGLTPIETEQGMMVLSAIVDITERKRGEREREGLLESERAARTEAERANRAKDEFLATVSHELRTPLNAVLGWSQLLARKSTDPATAQGLEIIERNARAQAQLIEDLLDMSRIISGKMRLNVEGIDLPAIIDAALASAEPAARGKGLELSKQLGRLSVAVCGDPSRIQQIIWNLVSNAIKFTPRGGRVRITLDEVDGSARIQVSDTGQGIKPEFLPLVFGRFRQADVSAARRQGGLGLGLSIVRHLAELHGGTATADSPGEGQGSTFTILLPLASESLECEGVDLHRGQSMSLAGVKALVVDDQADARELVRRLLEEQGVEVMTAGFADEALALVRQSRPDVVISDIGLPVVDGYQLVRTLRAFPAQEGGSVPAIALTAFVHELDRQRALESGYQAHVPKPVEASELLRVVAEVLRQAGVAKRTPS